MKKKIISEIATCYLSIFLACLLNLVIMAMLLKIINMFVGVSFFAQMVIRTVISFIAVPCIVGVIHGLVCYKRAEFYPTSSLLTVSAAVFFQLLLSILLKFHDFVSGGVVYLSCILHYGSSLSATSNVDHVTFLEYILSFLLYAVICIGVYLIFGFLGKKKRLCDREALTTKIRL